MASNLLLYLELYTLYDISGVFRLHGGENRKYLPSGR
jgi:hypothetical protein